MENVRATVFNKCDTWKSISLAENQENKTFYLRENPYAVLGAPIQCVFFLFHCITLLIIPGLSSAWYFWFWICEQPNLESFVYMESALNKTCILFHELNTQNFMQLKIDKLHNVLSVLCNYKTSLYLSHHEFMAFRWPHIELYFWNSRFKSETVFFCFVKLTDYIDLL